MKRKHFFSFENYFLDETVNINAIALKMVVKKTETWIEQDMQDTAGEAKTNS